MIKILLLLFNLMLEKWRQDDICYFVPSRIYLIFFNTLFFIILNFLRLNKNLLKSILSIFGFSAKSYYKKKKRLKTQVPYG